MKLEDQVVSLELSKQLKKAGYKQEGLWWWVEFINRGKTIGDKSRYTQILRTLELDDMKLLHITMLNKCVAPTVSELGEVLPQYIKSRAYMLTIVKDTADKWWIGYPNHKGIGVSDIKWTIEEAILANAMAKMWLYLKKEEKK